MCFWRINEKRVELDQNWVERFVQLWTSWLFNERNNAIFELGLHKCVFLVWTHKYSSYLTWAISKYSYGLKLPQMCFCVIFLSFLCRACFMFYAFRRLLCVAFVSFHFFSSHYFMCECYIYGFLKSGFFYFCFMSTFFALCTYSTRLFSLIGYCFGASIWARHFVLSSAKLFV